MYLSGTALGGLIFHPVLSMAGQTPNSRVHLPARVFMTFREQTQQLAPAGHQLWGYKRAWVRLSYAHGALQVEVSSPGDPLSNVILEWDEGLPGSSSILGDHWERAYGDLHFQPENFHRKLPWYFIQHDNYDTHCFGVRTGCNTICYWQLEESKMRLTLDTRSGGEGVRLGQRALLAAEVIGTKNTADENTFQTARRFCEFMCAHPVLPALPVYGINDWYFTYGMNSAEIIRDHTARMAELVTDHDNPPFSVVDSGWAAYSPLLPGDCCWQDDYSRPNDHFKDMHVLADDIKKLGMRPGLWTRPLCASHKDPGNILLPLIPGRQSPKKPVLDPSIPENLARIKSNIALYREWGYRLVKHDFTTYDMLGKWGFDMAADITTPGWTFHDTSKTTAEIVLQLYRTLREGAADVYLLGCNTLSHLSAGIFEINRIGDDTSGKEWDRTRKMGVNALGFRMVQHENFYAADGDCVGLTTAIPWEKNRQWMQLLAQSSAPLFISAQKEALQAAQKAYIRQSFATAARKLPVAEPLDWLEHQWPEKWRLNGKVVSFDWDID